MNNDDNLCACEHWWYAHVNIDDKCIWTLMIWTCEHWWYAQMNIDDLDIWKFMIWTCEHWWYAQMNIDDMYMWSVMICAYEYWWYAPIMNADDVCIWNVIILLLFIDYLSTNSIVMHIHERTTWQFISIELRVGEPLAEDDAEPDVIAASTPFESTRRWFVRGRTAVALGAQASTAALRNALRQGGCRQGVHVGLFTTTWNSYAQRK